MKDYEAERYEDEVNYVVGKGTSDLKELYKKFDSKVLNKIPKGPVKDWKMEIVTNFNNLHVMVHIYTEIKC
ncbi:hypothetical protein ACLOJK_000770 [Asimina triloba]